MNWSAAYVGIPWSEDDHGTVSTHCWGLARLAYAGEMGVDLPDFGPALDRASNAAKIEERRKAWPFREVQKPIPFDIVVYRVGAIVDHVGIIADRDLMLHVATGKMSEVISIRDARWRQRIVGFHRHVLRFGDVNV